MGREDELKIREEVLQAFREIQDEKESIVVGVTIDAVFYGGIRSVTQCNVTIKPGRETTLAAVGECVMEGAHRATEEMLLDVDQQAERLNEGEDDDGQPPEIPGED